IVEPIVCCPNDPDDAKTLSDVAGDTIDEVFIGSSMTNIGHFRAAARLLEGKRDIPTRLWVAPPTKMDAAELTKEGHYGTFGTAGARLEMPACALCTGNQAQVREGATVMSTSTRNFPSRLGRNSNVYLGSAELAAICSRLGRIPTREEYLADMGVVDADGQQIYRYMNFDRIEEYQVEEAAEAVCSTLAEAARSPGTVRGFAFSGSRERGRRWHNDRPPPPWTPGPMFRWFERRLDPFPPEPPRQPPRGLWAFCRHYT